jgi:pimeloyl-ACP methyl ester carboxylesterase
MRRLKRVHTLLALATVGVTVLAGAQSGADERLVDVGGRRLLISCKGDISPTVIIERGLAGNDNAPVQGPAFGGPWGRVQTEVAKFTRACIYSRANVGRSDPDPISVRTGKNVIDDLRRLLGNATLPPPYVLVGHSLGGVYARMYASRFPKDVVGMVLVESSHEDQVERLIAAGATEEDEALPPPNQNRERADLRATLDELRAMAWRTTIPLVVITRGTTMRSSYPHLTDEQVRRVDAAWRGLQRDLARRSSKGELMIAARSGHNVQADEPEVVIGAVREVVEQVRSQ